MLAQSVGRFGVLAKTIQMNASPLSSAGVQMRTKWTLPELPYDYKALEPTISAEIMQLHHQKHHKTYVDNLNKAEEKIQEGLQKGCANILISAYSALKFNGGGHINHTIFWKNLSPKGGGQPQGELLEAISKQFGSFDKFKTLMTESAVGVQGSGWAWLGYNKISKHVCIATCNNQDPLFPMTGYAPLLGIDVWEHAYYLQYKNVRADYVKKIWDIINWKDVQERFQEARK